MRFNLNQILILLSLFPCLHVWFPKRYDENVYSKKFCFTWQKGSATLTHPFSIFIWQPPLSHSGKGHWFEPLQAYTQEYALYIANLIHKDSRSVIKVVRYGISIKCFPDEKTVQLVERQIARQQEQV